MTNSSNQPSAELQWKIDQYILGSEELDCDGFEALMLEDEQIALWVAESVESLQMVAEATNINSQSNSLPLTKESVANSGGLAVTFLVTSAALLLAVLWSFNSGGKTANSDSENTYSQVAANWIALGPSETEQTEADADPDLTDWETGSSSPLDVQTNEGPQLSDDESESDVDWMLEAATDFYADLGS
ncbi:MAG: hypothetical protein AAF483_21730 [Planctomycetota bacterium]